MSEARQPLPMLLMWKRALRIRYSMRREEKASAAGQDDNCSWNEFPSRNDWREEGETPDLERVQEELLVNLAMSGSVRDKEMGWRKWDESDPFSDWPNKAG